MDVVTEGTVQLEGHRGPVTWALPDELVDGK